MEKINVNPPDQSSDCRLPYFTALPWVKSLVRSAPNFQGTISIDLYLSIEQ